VHRAATRRETRKRVENLLDEVGIIDPAQAYRSYPAEFSGGMRQRVMIAIAVALNPALIIADEPTTALDVSVQAGIIALLRRLQHDHGTAIVFVSHDLGVVAEIADDVVVVRDGVVVESGPRQRIYSDPREDYTRELLVASRVHSVDRLAAPRPPVDSPNGSLLRVRGLRKSYRARHGRARRQVIDGLDFTVEPGEVVGLVGESGSGKSTIGRIVAGLQFADAGEITLSDVTFPTGLGDGIPALPAAARRSVQMIFQDPYSSLHPRRTIEASLAAPLLAQRVDRSQIPGRVARAAADARVDPDLLPRHPAELSGGQRQRVAIARALVLEPALIVADEPLSSLDVTTQAEILSLIDDLVRDKQTAFLFITHDLGVVSTIAQRVIVLGPDGVEEIGTTAEVFGSPQSAYTSAGVVSQLLLQAPVSSQALRPQRRWRGLLADRGLLSGAVIIGVVIAAALLAPVFAALLGHGPDEQFPDDTLDAAGLPITGGHGFLLGADGSGRDVLVRTLYGARVSLAIGIPATTIAMIVGVVVGLTGGYFGGRIDALLSELTNVALAFPFLVTALSVVTLNRGTAGSTLVSPAVVVIGVVALFSWTYFARLVRNLVIEVKAKPFVLAAVGAGASHTRVIVREILPTIIPTIVIYWAVQLPTNIIAEASLSYLGVGIRPPTPSWGTMIANAQDSALYQTQPWMLVAPAVGLFVTVLGFNLLATRLRSRFDPTAA
jgi:ABC-type glutathione transport system ATPase component/ABC-type dipeptide/oligopeptide/nickel transport system permease subunit